MADTTLETLTVKIDVQTAGLVKGYDDAVKATQSTAANMAALMGQGSAAAAAKVAGSGEQIRTTLVSIGTVAKDVGANLGAMFSGGALGFAKGVGGLASNLGMFSSAAQGVAAAVNTWIPALEKATGALNAFMKAGAAVVEGQRKMAMATGLSLPSVAGLQHAANRAGFDIDEMSTGIAGLQRHLGQAINPTSEAARGIKAYGLNAAELANMGVDEALGKIGDALKNIENPAEKAAAKIALLGRRGMGLAPIAMRGSGFFKDAAEDADALGVAFSQADAARVKAMGDSGKVMKATLGAQLGGLQGTFASAFAPVATGVSTVVTSVVRSLTPTFQVVQGIFRVFGSIGEVVVNVGGLVGSVLGPAFKGVMGFASVIRDVIGAVGDTISGIAGMVKDVLGPAFSWVGGIIQKGFGWLGGVFSDIRKGLSAGPQKFSGSELGEKQLKDIKDRRAQDAEIRKRQQEIERLRTAPLSEIGERRRQEALNIGPFHIGGAGSSRFAKESEGQRSAIIGDLHKALKEQMETVDKLREASHGQQVSEATGKIEDQVAALDKQTGALGLTAGAAAKFNAVQDLMRVTGLSAEEATKKLGAGLDQLAAAQTRAVVAQSVDKLNDQTRSIKLQTMTLGMNAAMTQKYTAVAELQKQTGISTTEAWKQLAGAFTDLDAVMERNAVMQSRQKIEDQTRALEVQLATVGMTTEAAAKYTAIMELSKTAGISAAEATKRLTVSLDEQGRAQVALDSAKLAQAWKDEAETMLMAADVAERYRLAKRGANDEALKSAMFLKEDAANQKAIKEAAEKLTEEMRAPAEVFSDRMEELNQLFDSGKISAFTYGKAVEKAAGAVDKMNGSMGAIQGAAAGSAEAMARFASFQNDLFGGAFGRGGIKAVEGRLSVVGSSPDLTRQAQQVRDQGGAFLPAGGAPLSAPGPAPAPLGGGGGLGAGENQTVQLLREIRDALLDRNKKPGPDIRVGGLS